MDGSVLAVLAAYQNNLVTSKMVSSQVVQCLRVENVPKIRLLAGKSFKTLTKYGRILLLAQWIEPRGEYSIDGWERRCSQAT